MPDTEDETTTATVYQPDVVYELERDHAGESGQAISEVAVSVVEAGWKRIWISELVTSTVQYLRQQQDGHIDTRGVVYA